MRDCSIGIKIGSSTTEINLIDTYDFHLIESPAMVVPPVREYETVQYPESAAPEIDLRTVKQPFDYKISLGYYGAEEDANTNITTFFDSLFTISQGSDIRTAKLITLLNHYKQVQMQGYAKAWDGKKYEIQGEYGLVLFDFTIYVNDPTTLIPIPAQQ